MQDKTQIHCKLHKRLNTIFISVRPSYGYLAAIKFLTFLEIIGKPA